MERTAAITQEVEQIARTIPEVETVLRINGRGMISGAGSNYGMVIMRLKPWAERKGKGEDVQSIIGQMFARTSGIRDARIIFFAPPTIQGFGATGGFEFQLQDRSGGDIAKSAAPSSAQETGTLQRGRRIRILVLVLRWYRSSGNRSSGGKRCDGPW